MPICPVVAQEPSNQYAVPTTPDTDKVVELPSQIETDVAVAPIGSAGGQVLEIVKVPVSAAVPAEYQ